jgi:phosphoribosylglycinamide formyltransferase-1
LGLKLAILASGNGSNAQAIFDAVGRKRLDAEIRMVLCNRPGAKVLERAAARDIPCRCLDHADFPDRASHDHAMLRVLWEAEADTVALAGYMRLLSPDFLAAFPDRVLNIHPALLPAFPGLRGAADARARGVKLTGCTVHFVDREMDGGPIIIQACLPVFQDENADALQSRIHELEHRAYPQALQWLAEKRLSLRGRQVLLAPAEKKAAPPLERALFWPPLEQ